MHPIGAGDSNNILITHPHTLAYLFALIIHLRHSLLFLSVEEVVRTAGRDQRETFHHTHVVP